MKRCGVRVVTRDVISQPDLPGVGLGPRDLLLVSRPVRTLACSNSLLARPRRVEPTVSIHRTCEKRNPRGAWEKKSCSFGMVSQVINLGSHGCRVAGLHSRCQSSAGPGHGMEFRTKGHTSVFLLRPAEATNRNLAECHSEVLQVQIPGLIHTAQLARVVQTGNVSCW